MAHALATERRDDAEAQLWAASTLGAVGDAKGGDALLARALELDPKFAGVEAFRASWAQNAGDLDAALAAAERCLVIAPSATTCLRRRAEIHAIRGKCVAFADDTRELLLREPESDVNYENRLTALVAQGAPVDALRELAHKGEALVQDPKAARALAAANAARIAVYEGDFDAAEAKFIELEELVASSTDEIAHFPYVYRLGLYEEEGDHAKALASASDYLRRRPGWIYDGNGFPRAYALAIQHRYGALSDAELIAARTAWLAEDRQLAVADQSWAWLAYYAWPALTPAEARDAVAALPAFEPLGLDQLRNGHGAAAGRTFLLGGATERALPLLRDAAAWCGPTVETSGDSLSIGWQFVMIQSHLYLGLALEQRGDTAGACAEYARVLERWGHARPKSVTADAAREHATALGCAAGVTRAKQP
jgi:serine/threonine-protein kinase